jgi:hypothetical protein
MAIIRSAGRQAGGSRIAARLTAHHATYRTAPAWIAATLVRRPVMRSAKVPARLLSVVDTASSVPGSQSGACSSSITYTGMPVR